MSVVMFCYLRSFSAEKACAVAISCSYLAVDISRLIDAAQRLDVMHGVRSASIRSLLQKCVCYRAVAFFFRWVCGGFVALLRLDRVSLCRGLMTCLSSGQQACLSLLYGVRYLCIPLQLENRVRGLPVTPCRLNVAFIANTHARVRCKVIYCAGNGRLGERVACRAPSPRRKGVLFAFWPSVHHPSCLSTFELRVQSSKSSHVVWLNVFAI